MACYNIMSVIIDQRSKEIPYVQTVLTKYGCIIKVRLGLHEAGDVCSEEGLIILQLSGSQEQIKDLEGELNKLEGVTAKNLELCSK